MTIYIIYAYISIIQIFERAVDVTMDMAVDHDADNYYADSDKNFKDNENNIILCRILRTLVNKPHIKNENKCLNTTDLFTTQTHNCNTCLQTLDVLS